MIQDLPNIEYERSMNHNYLVLSKCDFFGTGSSKHADYRIRMLLENQIPGLLPVSHRLMNGESRYYYEINSLQSLNRLYEVNEIGYGEFRELLAGCVRLFDRLEEYLLDGSQIILKPEFIYINIEDMQPYFVCYPEYEGDVRLAFMELLDNLLTKIDHTDERAVILGYQVYRYTRNPNYVLGEISRMLEPGIAAMAECEGRKAVNSRENTIDIEKDAWGRQHGSQDICHAEDGRVREYQETAGNRENERCGQQAQDREGPDKKTNKMADIVGGIFCVFVSLCSGTIIFGARVLRAFKLTEQNELYLYAAMAMAVMAALLFGYCYFKKRKQDKEMASLCDDAGFGENESYPDIDPENMNPWFTAAKNVSAKRQQTDESRAVCDAVAQDACKTDNRTVCKTDNKTVCKTDNRTVCKTDNKTVCLESSTMEERVLCGRINGREVSISLDRLPMIVGKLASVADFVIDDTAVSKMHARFEERGGRVCICDLNSTNGTIRNGVLLDINKPVALEPGDRLKFGRTCFTYS